MKNIQQTNLKSSRQSYEKSLKFKIVFLNKVKNIVAKGEITYYEQFLLLPQCFQESSAADASKRVDK